jgi:CubicO group peptidase (beta-lactamase class C family)
MHKSAVAATAALLIGLFSCTSGEKQKSASVQSYDTAYRNLNLTDTGRLSRIRAVAPVIEQLFNAYAEKNHLPGLSWGLVVDGQLLLAGNKGYTDLEKKIPVTSSSLFRIASMSKSFTAMAILRLRDEGKLQLDDAVAKYVPEMKDQRYPTQDAPVLTIRHLLTHSAGFPEDNPWGDRQLADTDEEFRAFLNKKISFSNPPGIAYEYSNLGFALLGKIVSIVSGQPYQQYIREKIWNPLGMKSAEWEYSRVTPDKLAHGYRWINENWREEALLHDTPDGSWGAMGSMIASVEEFSRYMAFHLSAWPPSNRPETGPVKRSSVREMHQPWRFNGLNPGFKYPDGRTCAYASAYGYGLGWMSDCDGKVYIAHSGGLPGFGSQWRIMPDFGIGIVSLANRTYAPMGNINLHVLDTIIKLAGLQPQKAPASAILEQRQSELVKILPDWKNAASSGLFAENFFADNPIDSLRKYATQLFEKAGSIRKVEPMQPENQLRGRFMIRGEKADLMVYFTLSPENPPLIQEYRIWEVIPPKP